MEDIPDKPAGTPASEAEARLDEIKQALFRGRKIEAIRFYRDSLGGDLASVKEAVEKLETRLRQEEPDSFKAPAAGSGCGTAVLAAGVLLTGAVATWLLHGPAGS